MLTIVTISLKFNKIVKKKFEIDLNLQVLHGKLTFLNTSFNTL